MRKGGSPRNRSYMPMCDEISGDALSRVYVCPRGVVYDTGWGGMHGYHEMGLRIQSTLV